MLFRMLACSAWLCVASFAVQLKAEDGEWIELTDGKSFAGWKINENEESWSLEDGAFVAKGNRSHLFYVGDDKPFKDFELQLEVMTLPNSNGGVYFHTRYQDEDWPRNGFEAQVNNSYKPDPIKTGSLYQVVNNNTPPAKDNEWFKYNIRVEGKHVVVKINDKVIVDYVEPDDQKPGDPFTRVIDQGTFALQAHDPGSTVKYRNIKVRRLD